MWLMKKRTARELRKGEVSRLKLEIESERSAGRTVGKQQNRARGESRVTCPCLPAYFASLVTFLALVWIRLR